MMDDLPETEAQRMFDIHSSEAIREPSVSSEQKTAMSEKYICNSVSPNFQSKKFNAKLYKDIYVHLNLPEIHFKRNNV